MLDDVVFRAQFAIAWPIWAGGYPTQSDALQVLQLGETALRAALTERLRQLLDVDLRVELDSRIGAHAPLNGLWPKDYVPNSVDLFAVVYAPGVGVRHLANLTSRIGDAVEDVAGLVAGFAREQMPGAKRGANLYDVSGRWDPGPALAYAEVGEPLREVSEAVPPPRRMASAHNRVFVSYAHKDARWLTRLQVHLMPLARHHEIDLWDDTKIDSGMDWRTEIDRALQSAAVAVLLVSAHFLASDFIAKNELPPLLAAAEHGGTLVLPIIVAPSMFLQSPELSRYQAVNDPSRPLIDMPKGKQEKVFNETALRIRSHLADRR
jgi:hypothetical protein